MVGYGEFYYFFQGVTQPSKIGTEQQIFSPRTWNVLCDVPSYMQKASEGYIQRVDEDKDGGQH